MQYCHTLVTARFCWKTHFLVNPPSLNNRLVTANECKQNGENIVTRSTYDLGPRLGTVLCLYCGIIAHAHGSCVLIRIIDI